MGLLESRKGKELARRIVYKICMVNEKALIDW